MPPRATRRGKSTDSASPGSHKRKVEQKDEPASPARRSKRVKSTDEAVISVKAEIEETEVSIDASSSAGRVKTEETADVPATKPKAPKRRTKKEKEADVMPLRIRTQGLRMCVGAHVSAAKGVFNAVHNSMHIGGNAFALFLKSQRKWDNPALQDDHRDNFRDLCIKHEYDGAKHILPHGSYLVNLAQEDKAKAKQAYDSFLDDLRRCEALGITLYNFHPGSANQSPLPDALARLAKALTNALTATTTVTPVLETMCGHGTTIGGSLSEFRDLLALIPHEHHPRIGICIDTCHSFAAGYDLVTPAGFRAFMQEFDDLIGLQYLRALHLNDSKAPRGSKRDLHANIGTGFLGLRAFHNVMNEPRFEGLPMILETPIDRPAADMVKDEDGSDVDEDGEQKPTKKKKKPAKRPAAAKAQTVPDPSVWAREIELLESLIGMDPESAEFRELEAKLSEEGRESREKHQEQYERKLEAEEKKKEKGTAKKQKTLAEVMNGSAKKRKASAKMTDCESEDEGCQSC
ncbi:xylose isomerase-like protein [Aspergillus ambiguus]|uniref:DNA-(apurinic or apyrimidinic site) lyase APN1 n=1 Tax=Aspergillus ambiguus TaxID=176160 RepID=UPI003CCDB236